MAFALGNEQRQFIHRAIRSGRFNNQSEVVREALRRMAEADNAYLQPPPLTTTQIKAIYGRKSSDEAREERFGRAVFEAVRSAARSGSRP